jgi:Zinc carboxypeptidase
MTGHGLRRHRTLPGGAHSGFRLHVSMQAVGALLLLMCALAGCTAPSAPPARIATATDVPAVPHFVSVVTATIAPTATPAPSPTTTPTPTATSPFVEGPFPIGYSVQHRPIMTYRVGHGPIARALIGGLHGGYEWNTVRLMTETLDHLIAHPDMIPEQVTLYIVPVANPDGLAAGTDRVEGRLNAHQVDLNRNWNYQWQMTATHGTRPVSAGWQPFSEPETIALRDFLSEHKVEAVVFYHSAFAAVFSGTGVTTSHTVELAQLLAEATGYRYAPEGVPGQITTGNAIDWLTANGITAVEVELTNHSDLDWEQNLRGLRAFLNWHLPRRRSTLESAE